MTTILDLADRSAGTHAWLAFSGDDDERVRFREIWRDSAQTADELEP